MDVVNVSGSDTGQLGYAIPRWAWKIKRFKTVAAAPRIGLARPNARVRFDEFCILSGIDRTKRGDTILGSLGAGDQKYPAAFQT